MIVTVLHNMTNRFNEAQEFDGFRKAYSVCVEDQEFVRERDVCEEIFRNDNLYGLGAANGVRSLSVGDAILFPGAVYACASTGWTYLGCPEEISVLGFTNRGYPEEREGYVAPVAPVPSHKSCEGCGAPVKAGWGHCPICDLCYGCDFCSS